MPAPLARFLVSLAAGTLLSPLLLLFSLPTSSFAQLGPPQLASSAPDGTPANSGISATGGLPFAWNPDGARIAFGSAASNLSPELGSGLRAIYVKDLRTGSLAVASSSAAGVPLDDGGDGWPLGEFASWSPDGEKLAFSFSSGHSHDPPPEIHIKDLHSGLLTTLDTPYGQLWAGCCHEISGFLDAWSFDGTKLAWVRVGPHSVNGLQTHLYVTDVSTSDTVRASPDGACWELLHPGVQGFTWNPHRRQLAFPFSTNFCATEVPTAYVVSIPSGSLYDLNSRADGTRGDGPAGDPLAWSPDGNRIAFASSATNLVATEPDDTALYYKDLTTGAVRRIGGHLLDLHCFPTTYYSSPCVAWSPDGDHIAFAGSRRDHLADHTPEIGVFLFDLETGATSVVHSTVHEGSLSAIPWYNSLSWNHDGSHLAFAARLPNGSTSAATHDVEVYDNDLITGRLLLLSRIPMGVLGRFAGEVRWSPTGSGIAYTELRGSQLHLYVRRRTDADPPPSSSPGPGRPDSPPGGAPPQPPAPEPSFYYYVALGDSYSAGEGVDPYFRDGSDPRTGSQPGNIDNRCHRSTRAYAELVQPPGHSRPLYELASGGGDPGTGGNMNKYGLDANVRVGDGVFWAFWACSGATTANVRPSAEGGRVQEGVQDHRPQIDSARLSASTDLVTVTIGGNDAGFAEILQHCFGRACSSRNYRLSVYRRIGSIGGSLVRTYRAIKARAPHARVIVLGYPQVFPASSREQNCWKLRSWRGEQDFLRIAGDRLSEVIRFAASDAGVEYVDVRRLFAGHEPCGDLGEWIYGPSTTSNPSRRFVDDQTFHPNEHGQAAYAAALNSALVPNDLLRSSRIAARARRSIATSGRRVFTLPSARISCGSGPCSVSARARATARSMGTRTAPMRPRERVRMRTVARSAFALASNQRSRIRMRLTSTGRELLRRHKRVRTRIALVVVDAGNRERKMLKLTIKHRRSARGRGS